MNQVERFYSKTVRDEKTGCILWTGPLYNGYGRFANIMAHRWIFINYIGVPITRSILVCHKCDVRNCVNVDHLFLDSHKGNMDDAVRKRRMKRPINVDKRLGRGKGYSWNKRRQKWCAQITLDRKQLHLGYYDTETEARAAYERAVKMYNAGLPETNGRISKRVS